MLVESVMEIINEVWPNILLTCVVLSSIRITYLFRNKKKFIFHKELMMLLFAVYILCLFYVVTFQDVDWSSSNFIPFKEMFRYEFGSNMFFRNVVGNMLMFIPFGYFVSYLLNEKKLSVILVLTLITSLTIEITQLLIGRVFDIDDIILNIVGALLGFLLHFVLKKIETKLPKFLKNDTVYNIILIVIIVLIASIFIF